MDETQNKKPTAPSEILIESLDQLQALVEAPLSCEFKLDGTVIKLPCRRISQSVDEKVREIRRQAQPKWDPLRKDYDWNSPDFLKLRDVNEKVARALIIYSGCPAVAAKNPGLIKPEDIYRFVSGILSENVLEMIAATIQVGGMELVDRANFTSTAALES